MIDLKKYLEEQGYTCCENKESFDIMYPKLKPVHLRPQNIQPISRPSKYPCMVLQLKVIHHEYAADEAVLSILPLPPWSSL